MGQAKKDIPRWKRKQQRVPQGVVVVRGRNARAIQQQLIEQGKAKGKQPAGRVPQARGPVAATQAFRFRYQLAPLAWLAMIAAGAGAHYARAAALAVIVGVTQLVAVLLFTRHKTGFSRACVRWSSGIAAFWMLILPFTGTARPWAWVALASWAVPAALWVEHYRWRPAKAAVLSHRDTSVEETFAELAERRKWSAWLGPGRTIENGVQHEIICRGAHTNIDQIAAEPSAIAAAFDKAVTEAYAEPRPDGVKSRGHLTLLRTSTLDIPRPWDGMGINRDTGLARVGRFPDGKPVHERYFNLPRDGVKHTIVAGADGSGKTGLLDMGLSVSARSGIIAPVILDPQMGQALPAWREHVMYACGPDECFIYLMGLHAALMARSEYLGQLRWRDDKGRMRTGMGFFNPFMVPDLPIIEVTVDEAPVLLAMSKKIGNRTIKAVDLVLDIGKLGRKAGFRLRLAAQVPSLSELGKQELRSMLVGGNVFCLRTGDKVTGGMMNIKANPYELPKVFADGRPTHGLGYADTPDARASTPMRTDWVEDPYEEAEREPIRRADDMTLECLAAAIAAGDDEMADLARAADSATRRQLDVLRRISGRMTQGEVIAACINDFPLSEVTTTLRQLAEDGKVRQNADSTFEVVR